MGSYLTRALDILKLFQTNKESKILLLGLDGAGKTTILYKIKLNESISTIPTIGFNVETLTPLKGVTFTVWDIGGQKKIRDLWHYYFQSTDGLLFVVDSTDDSRFGEASEELKAMMNDDSMRYVPVVVIANKQDLPTAKSLDQIVTQLDLKSIPATAKWHIHPASAISGEGLWEAIEHLANMIKNNKKY